ncbi:shikimate dehydrogenase family protein [Fulvivirga sedimenti]|uniref:Shikimate dehydrogenase n=1 Tax=Fulvivirga sedimenti TaxID=2879465 RepID=A0A9X1HU27_9BACT|nr:shikimate dehydrogenase [Fulvivirga sedimenti]MCA6077961.1 shikimate dehydrogenase [Fulvivirga sedimenti]
MRQFGLIGKKLSHSFSAGYFNTKFKNEGLTDHYYALYEISSIEEIIRIFGIPHLAGLNVTIPYKQEIIPFLADLDSSAKKVGAVNVVKMSPRGPVGYNSDYYGFQQSLMSWLGNKSIEKALILGTGGAAKAVLAALEDLNIAATSVSRNPAPGQLGYSDLNAEHIREYKLIVNTTPLGMYPEVEIFPDIPYEYLDQDNFLYDLIYNPETTAFMKMGAEKGARVKNGLEMLHLQAERSWEIWNS